MYYIFFLSLFVKFPLFLWFSAISLWCAHVFFFVFILGKFSIVSSVFLNILILKFLIPFLNNCGVWITCGSASFASYFSWLSVIGPCFQWNAGYYVWIVEDLADSFLQRGFNILVEGRWQYGQITWIIWGTWIPIFLSLGPWGHWGICLLFSLLAAGFAFSASCSARM